MGFQQNSKTVESNLRELEYSLSAVEENVKPQKIN